MTRTRTSQLTLKQRIAWAFASLGALGAAGAGGLSIAASVMAESASSHPPSERLSDLEQARYNPASFEDQLEDLSGVSTDTIFWPDDPTALQVRDPAEYQAQIKLLAAPLMEIAEKLIATPGPYERDATLSIEDLQRTLREQIDHIEQVVATPAGSQPHSSQSRERSLRQARDRFEETMFQIARATGHAPPSPGPNDPPWFDFLAVSGEGPNGIGIVTLSALFFSIVFAIEAVSGRRSFTEGMFASSSISSAPVSTASEPE